MKSGSKQKNAKTPAETVTASSGNVFADLGLPNASIALAKANLALRICDVIQIRQMSQSTAADVLGVTQPKVSDLVRGKLDGYTIDRLLRFLNRLDQDVEISIRSAKGRKRPARTRVVST